MMMRSCFCVLLIVWGVILGISCRKQTESPQGEAPLSELEIPSELRSKILQPWTGDFNEMVKRRAIRALVIYSKSLYFLDKAEQKGVTYEALKEFESFINKRLKTGNIRVHMVFIPVSRDELIPGLLQGKGDLAVANLTITPERLMAVDFSEPTYPNVSEFIITGPNSPVLSTLDDLAGQEIYVRPSSSYYESLQALNELFRKAGKEEVKIVPVSEYLEAEDILEMVNAGLYPITVVDSHLAELWSQVFDHLQVHSDLAIRTGGNIAWAFRKNSPELKKVVNEFVLAHRKGTTFGNVLLAKYFRRVDWIKNNTADAERKRYEQMVGFFRKYAGQYDFDYLLMVAQGYQESQLDQNKRSRSGAVGVMQLLPSTAADRNVNIPNVAKSAENNIHAGLKYMRFMVDHYFADEPMDEFNKHLFAFASYNAGPGRIAGLRKKAAVMGLNPNVWFNNVEIVASREIGRETVQYVSNIYKYYLAYKQVEAQLEKKEKAREVAGATP